MNEPQNPPAKRNLTIPSETTFDSHAASYAAEVNQALAFSGLSVDYFTAVKAGYIIDILARHGLANSTTRLLDIGCGIGNYHAPLEESVGTITGVDVSIESLRKATGLNPRSRFVSYDGHDLPFVDGAFDAAIAIGVMHHVPPEQWNGFAREMRRVVRRGGVAMVFEHNPFNLLTQLGVARCPFDHDAVLLSAQRVSGLMIGAGFSQVRARHILTVPARSRFGRAVDRLFSRLPLGAQICVTAEA